MDTKNLSIVITTFRSEDKIYPCLESLPTGIRILVIENSNDVNFKKSIRNKYNKNYY